MRMLKENQPDSVVENELFGWPRKGKPDLFGKCCECNELVRIRSTDPVTRKRVKSQLIEGTFNCCTVQLK